jgi:chromosomal replication initiator protein
VSNELEQIWSRVQAKLALVVDEPTYRIWLEPLSALEYNGSLLVVQAPTNTRRWIDERFGRIIQASVEFVLGSGSRVELVTTAPTESSNDVTASGSARPQRRAHVATPRQPAEDPVFSAQSGPLGNPKLTFEQFVIGDCNRLAHAAALAVAEMPGQAYNPLFLCGPPGVGKTHLLSSIANFLTAYNPGLTVRCTTGETFTNEFIAALHAGETETFKLRFRDVDVLLIDDVQFLERKTKTEEEFFHTFNALHDGGRQIVLSSDLRGWARRRRQTTGAHNQARDPPQARPSRPHRARGRASDPRARRAHPVQHQSPRGSSHPRRRLRFADRQGADLGSHPRGPRQPLPPWSLAGRDRTHHL